MCGKTSLGRTEQSRSDPSYAWNTQSLRNIPYFVVFVAAQPNAIDRVIIRPAARPQEDR